MKYIIINYGCEPHISDEFESKESALESLKLNPPYFDVYLLEVNTEWKVSLHTETKISLTEV